MAMPTVLPAEVTGLPLPMTSKRKFSEIIDLTESDDAVAIASTSEPPRQANLQQPLPPLQEATLPLGPDNDDDDEYDNDSGDSSDEEYSESLFQDMMDMFELEPYEHDGTLDVSLGLLADLQEELRRLGIERFVTHAMDVRQLHVRQLGIVFGLNPNLDISDNAFTRLLSRLIERAHHKRSKLQEYNSIDDAAKLLLKSNRIMVITGAGISTSLGIPDFRSKESGFYTKLRNQGYSEPEEVFEIKAFDEDPSNFYNLAGDILPTLKKFSPTHAFIRLLQDKNRLQTNYTQNIDNLEALAGIDPQRLVQAHGSFAWATCRKCSHKVKGEEIFDDIRHHRVPRCPLGSRCRNRNRTDEPRPAKRPRSTSKGRGDSDEDDDIDEPGVMKPDITFFGEQLPASFFDRFSKRDAEEADLVIVIGTSMKVAPVAEMPNHLPHAIPHIYISREPVKHLNFDIQLIGKCDDVVVELCRRAGWELRHNMIPRNFAATVESFENSGHCWTVERVQPPETAQNKTNGQHAQQPETTQNKTNGQPVHRP